MTGPIKYRGQAQVQRDIANLKGALREASATSTVSFQWSRPQACCKACATNITALKKNSARLSARRLRAEYKAITDAGLIVQIDDAWLAAKYDVMVPPAKFSDYYAWAEQKVEALNRALDGIPAAAEPLPRVLGKLERTPHQRRCRRRHC